MNKDKKLEELERRQREIADEIKQLREGREPAVGDIYLNHVQTYEMYTEHGWVYMNPKEFGFPSSGHRGRFSDWQYLGKGDDVFITKKRVAEMLYPLKDIQGDSIMCPDGNLLCYDLSTLRKTLSNEGITEDLLK